MAELERGSVRFTRTSSLKLAPALLMVSAAVGAAPASSHQVGLGRAHLLGPTGCTTHAFHARVRGARIAEVAFKLDGRRMSTLTRRNRAGSYAVRIDPRRLAFGVHRLSATVTFQRGSATKAQTFRLAFQRCPRALRAPRFTG